MRSVLIRSLQRLALTVGGPLDDLRHYLGRVQANRLLFDLALTQRPDVVLACDLDTLSAGARLKKATGAKLIYDSHELFVEQYADWSRFRRWLYRRLEARLIRAADLVLTVGPCLAAELARVYSVRMPLVVMNGPSEVTSEVRPVHEPVRLLFQGAFAANRGLMPLVERMDQLRGAACLYLQGFGVMEEELRTVVEHRALGDVVVFVAPCRPSEVVSCARRYDVGVIAYPKQTRNLELATPNKLLDYLGAGLAIATVDACGVTSAVPLERCGVVFDAGDPDEMIRVLAKLVSDREHVAELKRRAAAIGVGLTWDSQFEPVVEWLGAPGTVGASRE